MLCRRPDRRRFCWSAPIIGQAALAEHRSGAAVRELLDGVTTFGDPRTRATSWPAGHGGSRVGRRPEHQAGTSLNNRKTKHVA